MKKLFKALTGETAVLLLSVLMVVTIFLSMTAFSVWMFKLVLGMLGVI